MSSLDKNGKSVIWVSLGDHAIGAASTFKVSLSPSPSISFYSL